MALNNMPTKAAIGYHRTLKVDYIADRQCAKRRPAQRLVDGIKDELWCIDGHDCQTYAIYSD
jgi:hypothetical protein